MDTSYSIHTHSRTAGTMPVWTPEPSSQAHTENNHTENNQGNKSAFGFSDFIDMINPLQHIPLVNIAYQKLTHDEIKPVSQIVGGAVFGGALGAGSALVNVAVEAETGKDIGEHALAFATEETHKRNLREHDLRDDPEENLNNALAMLQHMNDTSALAYANLGGEEQYKRYDTQPIAQGRTAGERIEEHFDLTAHKNVLYREPITELKISPLPPKSVF